MKNLVYQSYFFVPGPPVVALHTEDYRWFETPGVQPPRPHLERGGLAGKTLIGFPVTVGMQTADYRWMETPWVYPPPPRSRVHVGGISHKVQFSGKAFAPLTAWSETSPPVLPRRYHERGGAAISGMAVFGFFDNWYNWGWETPWTTALPTQRKVQSLPIGDVYFTAPAALQTADYRWFETPFVYPRKNYARAAAIMPSVNVEARFQFWYNSGWEVQSVQPPSPQDKLKRGAIFPVVNVERPYVDWKNFGWEVQSVQPPHEWVEKRGATLRGIDGNEARYEFWRNAGWEVQSWQPPYGVPVRRGSILRGDDGIQGTKAFGLQTADYRWFETPWVYPRFRYERAGAVQDGIDGTDRPFIRFFDFGWPIQSWQPPHYKPENRGGILKGDDGTQGIKPFGLQTGDFRWMETPWVYPRTRFERVAAILEGIDGIEGPFSLWRNAGWEVQPWQPPHRTPEVKGSSFLRGDDGNAARYEFWRNFGWEIQGWQPPHERSEQKGAILKGDDGTQGTKPFGLQTGDYPWMQAPFVYPRFVFQKAGAILEGIDGIDARFELWRNYGWDAQLALLRNVRRGVVLKGDDGLFRQVALLTNDYRWMETPWVFPRKAYNKTGILEGIDGIEPPYQFFRNFGWVIQAWQPPHRRPERNAAILEGIDGTDARYEFFRAFGWPVQPWQPPHPRPERSGVQFGGDRGNYSVFIAPLQTASYPWFATPLFQPPHTWYERHGAILEGIDGIEFIFNFVPPPVPRTKHSRFNRYAGRDERDNTPDDTRDNFARETRRSGVVPRRFNTWRSDR